MSKNKYLEGEEVPVVRARDAQERFHGRRLATVAVRRLSVELHGEAG